MNVIHIFVCIKNAVSGDIDQRTLNIIGQGISLAPLYRPDILVNTCRKCITKNLHFCNKTIIWFSIFSGKIRKISVKWCTNVLRMSNLCLHSYQCQVMQHPIKVICNRLIHNFWMGLERDSAVNIDCRTFIFDTKPFSVCQFSRGNKENLCEMVYSDVTS